MGDEMVIHERLGRIVKQYPSKTAIKIQKNDAFLEISYEGLKTAVDSTAAFLLAQGFHKGDRVSLIMENRVEWPIIYFGIINAGLTCVPIDPSITKDEIRSLLIDSETKLFFSSGNVFGKHIPKDIQIPGVVVEAQEPLRENIFRFSDIDNVKFDASPVPEIDPEDIASLVYTSGTTGVPKGVMLSHANIYSNFIGIKQSRMCTHTDVVLSILPLYHTYAFMITMIVPLLLGSEVVYCAEGFKPSDLGVVMNQAGVTIFVGVPQIYSMINNSINNKIDKVSPIIRVLAWPLIKSRCLKGLGGELRMLVSGGARLDPETSKKFQSIGIPVIEGYGLTETSPVVSFNPKENIKLGSVGKPLFNVEVKILDPDESGIGQILIKGPNVMKGYYRQPEATADVIKDGWFYSGDLGYIDRDGYIYLKGRLKDVIVLSNGKNIYPGELEEYYGKAPYVKEICIINKSELKFQHRREVLYAVIVPDIDLAKANRLVDVRGKIQWELENLQKDMPLYKRLMGLIFTVDQLPRTALKKIRRYEVRQRYMQEDTFTARVSKPFEMTENDRALLNNADASKIMHYISDEIGKDISVDDHLEINLGIDSLGRVELLTGLEAVLSVKIPYEAMSQASTVRDLISGVLMAISGSSEIPEKEQRSWKQILLEPLDAEILKDIKIKRGFFDKWLLWFFVNIVFFPVKILWPLKTEGRENLPSEGPAILCPNHASYLDGFTIARSLPSKARVLTYFAGFRKIFMFPLIKWGVKIFGLLPIDSNRELVKDMKSISFVLSKSKVVCLFPEGQRSISEEIARFKKGIGILAKELNVPVVPVYIKNSHKSWPRGSMFPQPCFLKVIFGRPVYANQILEQYKDVSGNNEYEKIANALRLNVRGLGKHI